MRIPVCTLFFLLAAGAWAVEPGVTDLGQGIGAYNSRDFAGAVSHLKTARSVIALSDYVTYHLAYSEVLTGDVDGALALLNAYRAKPIDSSPLAGKISLLYGRTLLDKRDPALSAKALSVLQDAYKILPQPDGDFALGLAYEALGEQPQAALSYEKAFYEYPNTDLAAQSATAIQRLRTVLGKDFPTASARQQLDRCERWLDAKQYAKARPEYAALAESLTGPEKDEAKVGIGKTDYMAGNFHLALVYLKELHTVHGDADAERLYYLVEGARKSESTAGNETEMMAAVKQLAEHYAQSPWRLKALIAAGDQYLLTNDREQYIPLFKAAADAFPEDKSTAYAHWKVAWDAYLSDKPDRATLLREQVERYPDDSHAGTALYFLGRIAETDGKFGEARAYYDRISAQFPHFFYGVLARTQLRDKVAAATADDDAVMWLEDVDWPVHRDLSATEPNAATERRIQRARLLIGAALPDLAEAELRFGAKTDNEQPQLLAMELAQSADSAFRALKVMKSFSSDYLSMTLDKAPVKFWQMLFPLPYKDDVFVNARERGLDPWDVAALIRQESEFNPAAKSTANAYGLMQLRPPTGKMLGRQEGMGAISTNLLLNPAVSIKLGTEYLRQQLSHWDGDLYRTLAAYNAGPGRVREWLMWMNYREPAEFVENIPFTQTREYIQAVLRNADIYRELYSKGNVPVPTAPSVQLTSLVKPAVPTHTAPIHTAKAVPHPAPAPKKVLATSAKKSVPVKKAAPKKAVTADRSTTVSTTTKKHEPA